MCVQSTHMRLLNTIFFTQNNRWLLLKSVASTTRVLYDLWQHAAKRGVALNERDAVTYQRIWSKCRKVLEHLFRIKPSEVTSLMLDHWHAEGVGEPLPPFFEVDHPCRLKTTSFLS